MSIQSKMTLAVLPAAVLLVVLMTTPLFNGAYAADPRSSGTRRTRQPCLGLPPYMPTRRLP